MNTALTFCYQLQGFAEISNQVPTSIQWGNIVEKLDTVSIEDLIIETDNLMAQETFIIWLKGYVDLAAPSVINEQEWKIIKDHLQLVFTKVTPNYEDEDDLGEQAKRIKELFQGYTPTNPLTTLPPGDKACCSHHKTMC